MLRLNEIKLPLNHEEPELAKAILVRLKISPEQMLGFTVYKRSYDARKKANISLIYSSTWKPRTMPASWPNAPTTST